MSLPVITDQTLPSLIDHARSVLAGAMTSAEVLEAREAATFAYDSYKRDARLKKAKGAHDDLIAAAHRAQADALEIEALAKRRLADEYDAAQERGEVGQRTGRPKVVPEQNNFSALNPYICECGEKFDTHVWHCYECGGHSPVDLNHCSNCGAVRPLDRPATAEDIGLTRKQIYEARQIRDAEQADPGIVRATLDSLLAAGEEPTRAAVTNAIVNRTSFTGNNQWFTPQRFIELARNVMGAIDLDPATHPTAQQKVQATSYYTEEDDGLKHEWRGRVWLNPPYSQPEIGYFVDKLVDELIAGRTTQAIMLTHNYTDTAWFQKAAREADAICFTRGRIRFESPTGELASPTQGQAFFYFGNDVDKFRASFSDVGFVVEVRS